LGKGAAGVSRGQQGAAGGSRGSRGQQGAAGGRSVQGVGRCRGGARGNRHKGRKAQGYIWSIAGQTWGVEGVSAGEAPLQGRMARAHQAQVPVRHMKGSSSPAASAASRISWSGAHLRVGGGGVQGARGPGS
jgi:hypothetical protein